jgi:hypothetical protein
MGVGKHDRYSEMDDSGLKIHNNQSAGAIVTTDL